jgi:hypothetical protein
MAIIYTSWRAETGGQSEIKHYRSDQRDFHELKNVWVEEQQNNPECVLITKSRTDNQSSWEVVIWQKPGYTDPTSIVSL